MQVSITCFRIIIFGANLVLYRY